MLLSTAYFPPVEYFALIARGFTLSPDRVNPSLIYIEACENFQKQSYRNRCHFYAGDGIQTLSFPIKHKNGTHNNIPITEVEVDYSTPWVQRHIKALISAYRTSAYFDYYCDGIFTIMESRPETLFELNTSLLKFLLKSVGIAADIRLTDDFEQSGSCRYGGDYREIIHPKRQNSILEELNLKKPYFQVFSGKYGFIPNLSVIDLLFNEGPDSIMYLKTL